MKFTYEYRTSNNERRCGIVCASSRDNAYLILKKNGVKPSRVELAPGIINAIAAYKGKIIISLIGFVSIISFLANLWSDRLVTNEVHQFNDKTRRQIIGDSFIVEKGIRTAWSDVFEHDGERFLASFAIPAAEAGLKNTTVEELQECLKRTIVPTQSDGLEVRQIKAIVEGMKLELKVFLKDGGTVVEYGECLTKRQEKEIQYYNRAKNELKALIKNGASDEEIERAWESKNIGLRNMGIKAIKFDELNN